MASAAMSKQRSAAKDKSKQKDGPPKLQAMVDAVDEENDVGAVGDEEESGVGPMLVGKLEVGN